MLDEGAQAAVFDVSPTVVAKVYNAGTTTERCHATECEMLQTLEATGIAPRMLSSFVCHTHDVRGLLMERINLLKDRPRDYNVCAHDNLSSEEQEAMVNTILVMLRSNVLQNDAHLGNWGFRTTLSASPVLFDYGHAMRLPPKRSLQQDALLMAYTLNQVLENFNEPCHHTDGVIVETLGAAVYLSGFNDITECIEEVSFVYPDLLSSPFKS